MVDVPFSGQEVLKLAIQIEKNGKDFYENLAQETRNEDISSTFNYLVKEEIKHKERFQEMLHHAKRKGEDLSAQIFVNLEDEYLKSFADSKIFASANKHIKRAQEAADEKELLNVAISIELDSILFYYEMEKVIRKGDKKIVQEVIEEEKNHVRELMSLK